MDTDRIAKRLAQAETAKTAYVTWLCVIGFSSTLYLLAFTLPAPWYWISWVVIAGFQISAISLAIGQFKLYIARRNNQYAQEGYRRVAAIEHDLNSAR